jgi:hypothetical protein
MQSTKGRRGIGIERDQV